MPSTEPSESNQDTHDETIIHVITSNPQRDHFVALEPSSSSSRKLPGLIAVLLLLVVAVGAFTLLSSNNNSPSGSTASLLAANPGQVSVTDAGFTPATITVKVGQAVTWTNTDSSAHTVASDPYPNDNALPGLNSEQSLTTANDHYTFVFRKAGTYTYHDDLNPYTLEGTVVVKQ